MRKGRAVLRYAEVLEQIQPLMWSASNYSTVLWLIDEARASIQEASELLGGDDELDEIDVLLATYRDKFD